MILKIVSLFLVAMGVLAMFGKLRVPKGGFRRMVSGKCRACGRYRIGSGPCACGDRGKG